MDGAEGPADLNSISLPFLTLQQLGSRISPTIAVLDVDIAAA